MIISSNYIEHELSQLIMSIWLASGSTRRKQILSQIFPKFDCYGVDADESMIQGAEVEESIQAICERKAEAANHSSHDLVVVSDTMIIDPKNSKLAIGKPKNDYEARLILEKLRGEIHTVVSSTGIRINGKWQFFQDSARVKITDYSDENLEKLVTNGSWRGKAGGYDLAGDMRDFAQIESGSEFTVLGIAENAMLVLQDYSS